MSKRMSATKPSTSSILPLHQTLSQPIIDRRQTDSPPASAYFSPDGHQTVAEEEADEHFSFSTTLRRHRRQSSDFQPIYTENEGFLGWRRLAKRVRRAVGKDDELEGLIGASSVNAGGKEEAVTASAQFCTMSVEQTLSSLHASPKGHLHTSIPSLLEQYGYNEFSVPPPPSFILKFIEQITDSPLILLLLGSAAVSFLVGNTDDAVSITLAILIVLLVGFVQERRSEESLKSLGGLVPHSANVIRRRAVLQEGEESSTQTVLANELVPGDIVTFSTGDRVPADVRLLETSGLEIDESSLTGEGKAKAKVSIWIRPPGPPTTNPTRYPPTSSSQVSSPELADRPTIAHLGTLVRAGHGRGVVIATGTSSEFGKIFETVQSTPTSRTPLQTSMDELAKTLSILSFGVIGIIVLVGVVQKRGFLEMFTVGVSLAVAAIPEGLPIVTTVTLALGVLRMSKKRVIVKRIHCVEVMGCVGVVGVDKTGTLTKNEMTAVEYWTPSNGVTSIAPPESGRVLGMDEETRRLFEVASAANNAILSTGSGADLTPIWTGQSTDVALMRAAVSFGVRLGLESGRGRWTRNSEVPFSSETKWMGVEGSWIQPSSNPGQSSAGRLKENGSARSTSPIARTSSRMGTHGGAERMGYAKGAVEVVLPLCSFAGMGNEEALKAEIIARIGSLSARGLRVIACAYTASVSSSNPYAKMTFAGLIALHDPPREGVKDAIAKLKRGGVKVVMITGDGEATACAIARQVGILSADVGAGGGVEGGQCITGGMIDAMNREELASKVKRLSVFARTSPKHKMRIVEAFKDVGEVVGMTGDGVNDAPALKRADIGISMGGKMATDVAKEAADVILVDDEFGTILAAVEEGKCIFHNIQNFLSFQLSTAVAALSLITLSTVFHLANPLNAMQILFINILMDGPPSQSLGVDPVDPAVMRKPPRKKDAPIITKRLVARVLFSASMIIFGTLYVYVYGLSDTHMSHRDQTMTFTTFVLLDLVSALQNRSLHCSITANRMLLTTVSVSLLTQMTLIYVPFMQAIFQTESLSGGDMRTVGLLAAISWTLHELRRMYERRRDRWETILSDSSGPGETMV